MENSNPAPVNAAASKPQVADPSAPKAVQLQDATFHVFKNGGFDEHVWLGLEIMLTLIAITCLLGYFGVFTKVGITLFVVLVSLIFAVPIAMSWHLVQFNATAKGVQGQSSDSKNGGN